MEVGGRATHGAVAEKLNTVIYIRVRNNPDFGILLITNIFNGLRPDMTSYLKESLSVSIGCYGPTLMHSLMHSNAFNNK